MDLSPPVVACRPPVYFNGTRDFDPSASTYNVVSAGSDDVFITKLDSDGDVVWARGMGSTAQDIGFGVAAGSDGKVFSTGFVSGSFDADPDSCTQTISTAGGRDIFVWSLDSGGDFN